MSDRTMSRATIFANTLDCGENVLHIYDDGYVVAVACSVDRHLALREMLKPIWPDFEEARSDDGYLSVFVLPALLPLGFKDYPPMLIGLTDGPHDHRWEDWNDLDGAAECLKPILDMRKE